MGKCEGMGGGIRDAVSQTVGAKKINGMQCSTVTLGPTFWGHNVTSSGGRATCPLLGLSITWLEPFWVVSLRS